MRLLLPSFLAALRLGCAHVHTSPLSSPPPFFSPCYWFPSADLKRAAADGGTSDAQQQREERREKKQRDARATAVVASASCHAIARPLSLLSSFTFVALDPSAPLHCSTRLYLSSRLRATGLGAARRRLLPSRSAAVARLSFAHPTRSCNQTRNFTQHSRTCVCSYSSPRCCWRLWP